MDQDATRWRLGERFGLLFLGLLFAFYIIPDMLTAIPALSELFQAAWYALWAALMPILGNALLGIEGPIPVEMTGSGDMTWHYVQGFWYLVIAAGGAALALARDRRGRDYDELHAWVRILVRYGLSLAMFGYGLAKLTGNQFGELGPLELTRSYGDSSPMGLLWTYMGYSPVYAGFTGLAEVAAGALLLARRTTTLGALLACGVMANVVMINFCFDVPVKLYASLLLLMAIFLAAGDARRLIALFLRNQPTAPRDLARPAMGRTMLRTRRALKVAFILAIVASGVMQRVMVEGARGEAVVGPLHGAWEVEAFTLDGEARTRVDDEARWRWLAVSEYGFAIVRPMRGEVTGYRFTEDREAGTITLSRRVRGEEERHVLQVAEPGEGELVLTGAMTAGAIEVRLRRVDTAAMLLPSRGFHWVQERPYNR